MANERFVTIENRVFNAQEGRTTITGGTGWFSRTLHTIGSGNVKDLFVILDGYLKSAGSAETNLANPFVIDKMTFEIVGQPLRAVTFGGNRAFTVTSGLSNYESDISTAAQLKSSVSLLPIGTEIWVKAQGTVAGVGATYQLPTCVRNSADASGTQFGWYNATNTTLVNDADVAGAFTWTGTNADTRTSGWAPQIGGHFEDGTDPVVMLFDGDSITQGLQDNTAKRTGRGWPQYVLYGDGTSSPTTGIRAGLNLGVSGDSFSTRKTATRMISKAKYCTDVTVATGTNDISINGTGNPTSIHSDKLAMKALYVAAITNTRTPKTMFIQLQPQSTTGSPTKTINSAPNTGWGVGEKSAQVNALALAEVGTNVTYYVPTPSIRQSTDSATVEHFLWKYTGGTNAYDTTYTPDGQHPGNIGVVAWAGDVNPTYRLIAGGALADTTPNAFTFTDVTGATLSTVYTSNTITVSGIDSAAVISVVGGTYKVNSGSYVSTPGTVVNGDTVTVRSTSSSGNSTAVDVVLSIGGVTDTYTVTTAAGSVDTTPDIFSFTPVTNAALSSTQTSNTVTIAGINAAATVTISGGSYSINGGSFVTSSGTITNGQTIAVRGVASSANSTESIVALTIGGVTGNFSVTTEAAAVDTTPNSFSFTPATNVALSTTSTSSAVTITGINTAAPVSISNGEYSIDGGAWASSTGSITTGQTIAVRRMSSSSNSTAVTTTLTIGGVSADYSITTAAASDTTPSTFSFTAQTGASLSQSYVSNAITVAGIDAAAAISVAGGEYRINSGSWVTAPGTVVNGDVVTVRRTSSSTNATTVATILNIGGVSGAFSVTTVQAAPEITEITATSIRGFGSKTVSTVTLGDTGSITFNPAKGPILLMINETDAALAPTIYGSDAHTIEIKTVGVISLEDGYQCEAIQPGGIAVVALSSISSYLRGTVTITGGTGIKASILEN